MEVTMPKLCEWQKDVFDDIVGNEAEIYVVKARRQCGKSIMAETVLLFFALGDKSTSVMIEPTLSQGRRVYKQIVDAIGGEKSPLIKSANSTLLTLEFTNGSEIVFKSAEQMDALRGLTVKRGILIIDEAAFIKDDIFEILYPLVDANKAPVMLISTPLFLSGEFYKKYTEGLNSSVVRSYDWARYDTSIFLSEEKLEYYRQTISPLKFRSEYLGQFIAEGSYIFGDFSKCIGERSKRPPVYGGIDWSNQGENDFSVLTLMDDEGGVTELVAFNNESPLGQIDRFEEVLNRYPSIRGVQVELNSIGTVYYELLRRKLKIPIYGFQTTNESKREIVENLMSAFENGKVRVPDEPELIRELQHYNLEKTPSGKITYNGADGVNDDYVMSLAFAYDLYKKRSGAFEISFA